MRLHKLVLGVVSLVLLTSVLAGCNTVRGTASGFGQDVNAAVSTVN